MYNRKNEMRLPGKTKRIFSSKKTKNEMRFFLKKSVHLFAKPKFNRIFVALNN